MNSAVYERRLPNALPMFQPKCITSIAFNFISLFLAKAANAFLPKLVYQLEEYGLPRTLSRKIQNSGLIDLENDEMEVSDIIEEFKKIGYDKLTESIQDIHQFEKFILKYFYSGIS